MARGNDGSGWSMSVWPRYVDRIGEDKPSKGQKLRRTRHLPDRKPPKTFEDALVDAIGEKAAKAYIRRKQRRERSKVLAEASKEHIELLKKRMADIEAGTVWASAHPGPYTPEEKAAEIAALKAQIAKLESDFA